MDFGTKFLIIFTFFESLKIFFLINVVTILMISAKLTAPDLLKIKKFRNGVIFLDYDVTTKFYDMTQIIF